MIRVRITPTIAGEYESRCPESIPERLRCAGTHELSPAEAEQVLLDARWNSDRTCVDVGPYAMPLSTFNAYRALAAQVRTAIERSEARS